MTEQISQEKMSPVKLGLFALVFIWIVGSAIAGLHNNYVQKRQCIQNEGWLKGWLWCSTETQYSFGINMLRGLIWPIDILNN